MTYRVELHAAALAQLHGLPRIAFDALIARTVKLVDAPWDAAPLYADEPAYRQTVFGDLGLLTFYVDDDRQILVIYNVTWAG